MSDPTPLPGPTEAPKECCEPYRQLIRFFMDTDDSPARRKEMGEIAIRLWEWHMATTAPDEAS